MGHVRNGCQLLCLTGPPLPLSNSEHGSNKITDHFPLCHFLMCPAPISIYLYRYRKHISTKYPQIWDRCMKEIQFRFHLPQSVKLAMVPVPVPVPHFQSNSIHSGSTLRDFFFLFRLFLIGNKIQFTTMKPTDSYYLSNKARPRQAIWFPIHLGIVDGDADKSQTKRPWNEARSKSWGQKAKWQLIVVREMVKDLKGLNGNGHFGCGVLVCSTNSKKRPIRIKILGIEKYLDNTF